MDLTQLANLGEAIGGLAVVGSLLYLGHEVRMGTRTLRTLLTAYSHLTNFPGQQIVKSYRLTHGDLRVESLEVQPCMG